MASTAAKTMTRTVTQAVTRSVEDYLKAIFAFSEERLANEANTGDLAAALNVSPPAISKMLKQLQTQRLVTHTPYHGVRLTAQGRRIALRIVRRHRLLERYLVEALGYALDEVHDEAERLEHHVSDDFIRRIDAHLNHPHDCPHGSPIPTVDGHIIHVHGQPLSDAVADTPLHIKQLTTDDAEHLRFMQSHALLPGARLRVVNREPFGGDLTIMLDDTTLNISRRIAGKILVAEPA